MVEEKCIFSVVGNHAGNSLEKILRNKSTDIRKFGYTLWLQCSAAATPSLVQHFCDQKTIKCYFISTSANKLASDTKERKSANEYSKDYVDWVQIPKGFGPVTGRINRMTQALVLGKLEKTNFQIDIGKYIMPRISLGCSTVCAIKNERLIFSNVRTAFAVATLVYPWCVYLR